MKHHKKRTRKANSRKAFGEESESKLSTSAVVEVLSQTRICGYHWSKGVNYLQNCLAPRWQIFITDSCQRFSKTRNRYISKNITNTVKQRKVFLWKNIFPSRYFFFSLLPTMGYHQDISLRVSVLVYLLKEKSLFIGKSFLVLKFELLQ